MGTKIMKEPRKDRGYETRKGQLEKGRELRGRIKMLMGDMIRLSSAWMKMAQLVPLWCTIAV